MFNRYAIEGFMVGGTPETQKMLDFCAKHNIVPEYRVINAKDANLQFKALVNGETNADRCVIAMVVNGDDAATTTTTTTFAAGVMTDSKRRQ
jgi:D-arabinose 1-dehydrogenase-like Zn-dependent alcohol dehydrogenase